MFVPLCAALVVAGASDVTWHQDVEGKVRIGVSGGIDDRAVSAEDRKRMLADLDPWVVFFQERIPARGIDVLLNKGARGHAMANGGPYAMSVDVMLFRYLSSPRWGNRVEPEDETGRTIHVNINSVHPLGDSLYEFGKSEKGGSLFLQPPAGRRHGFVEYELSPTSRGLVLAPPGLEMFLPVSRKTVYAALKPGYEKYVANMRQFQARQPGANADKALAKAEATLAKFEADHAALTPAELEAPAMVDPDSTEWRGLAPPRGRAAVKYNPKFFKTRTRRTEPHFAMVWWSCSHMSPGDFPEMESLVERLDWQVLAAKLSAPAP